MRDLSRLETTELHLEKVIDLTDKQTRLFGLVETSDAVLLVATGDAVVGIDLGKLDDRDIQVDRDSGAVRITLPPPEILSVRLDEEHTYVYQRTTGLLARREEQLESRARQEALRTITNAVGDTDVMDKARRRAEQQVRQLLERFGVTQISIGWRPS
jgi:hypothetical protein